MKKLIIPLALTLAVMAGACGSAEAAPNEAYTPETASPAPVVVLSDQSLTVDGAAVACEKYNIDGYNYFRLRDLAYALNGSPYTFGVGYDEATNTVTLTPGAAYTPDGSELQGGTDLSATAVPSAQRITLGGMAVESLSVYNIGGNNYFKLRDLADAVGFTVGYDEATRTATVSTGAEPASGTAADPASGCTGVPLAPTESISWNSGWQYAANSKIHSSDVTLYRAQGSNRNGIVIAVNAGHGTAGGYAVKTLCHPDGSPKVTGGSTGAGATEAIAVSGGTVLLDGTPEPTATLALAQEVKTQLLAAGYDVLMLRDGEDAQLDNIARTVFANNNADCHIALHYDSTENDKGFFYIGVPDIASYRNMEPVKSHWQQHTALGEALLSGVKATGVKVWSSGTAALDLTQTSYSTVPSVDVEVGDRGSDHSPATLQKLAQAIVLGLDLYYQQ